MFLEDVSKRYESLCQRVNELDKVVEYRNKWRRDVEKSIKELEVEYDEGMCYLEKFKKAKRVIQKITDTRNESVKEYIKDVVNKGLTAMLQRHDYNLEIQDGDRGDSQKVTEIQLISTKTGKPRKVGMAVKQITSLIFIISLLEIAGSSKILALDEYLSGASDETAAKLSDILVALAKNNEFQFFVVNHVIDISENPEFERVYLVKESDEEGLKVDVKKTEEDKKRRLMALKMAEEDGEVVYG